MAQTWEDVLFLHWPMPRPRLEALLPPTLPVETFEGAAWLTITALRVRRLRIRGLPAVPGLSDFPEVNVRTYAALDGRPGVVFLSLDADTRLGVLFARLLYRLPYFFATARWEARDDRPRFTSRRECGDGAPARFTADYGPAGPVRPASPSTLDGWLTERYCLYTWDADHRVYGAEIHHPPWPLQRAEVDVTENSMTEPLALPLGEAPALAHYARRLEVEVWPLRRLVRPGARPVRAA